MALICVGALQNAGAQSTVGNPAPQDDNELTQLQESFTGALSRLDKPQSDLKTSFVDALDRLLRDESKKGNLEGAAEVKREIDAFGDGSAFVPENFLARATSNVQLEKLRSTFLAQRSKIDEANALTLGNLADTYRQRLLKIEQEQTRQGNLDLALAARKERERNLNDPRFPKATDEKKIDGAFEGRLIFAGKGEFEIRLNGDQLRIRNEADNRAQYLEGESQPETIKPGDIVVIRMRSFFVFRAFVCGIEAEDGSLAVPFRAEDYRMLDDSHDVARMEASDILKLPGRPTSDGADSSQVPAWTRRDLSEPIRQKSEWVRMGSGDEWFRCAVVVRDDMFVKIAK